MSDRELLKLLRRKPYKGFETMVGLYGGLLYTLVRGRLPSERFGSAEVEDVVADTLSDFYLHLGDYRPELCSIKSYLCVIARRKAADRLRREKLTTVPLEEVWELPDAADTAQESELRAELLRAIQNLGEPDSSIIIRKYYLGQPSKEIAAALELSVSNVDTRAHRAIEKLRRVLIGDA